MATDRRCCPATGSGPRSSRAARRVLDARRRVRSTSEHLVGGASIDANGVALTDEVLDACRPSDAVLLGAVGGPKWDTTDPDAPRPEQGLLGLRKGLGLLREPAPGEAEPGADRRQPAAARADLGHRPARRPRAHRRDLLRRQDATDTEASDTCVYTRRRDRADRPGRVRRRAASTATGSPRSTRPTCSRRRGCGARRSTGVAADYPDVELDHMLVDNAAMQLVSDPARFDVI